MAETFAPVQTRPAEWRDYFALMKPRVMSLVVFTAAVGLLVAPGEVHPVLALAIIAAIAVGAGGAGALNMAYDADIDAVMRRTCARPVPAGRVSRAEAYGFGLVVSALAVTILYLAGGPLAAGLLAFTIFFYAVIYTAWLKRTTTQNIVIGGLAGALPPAVAWAGATGALGLDPALLVAIIFFWTPPHFWALALYKSGDYEAAGVPMLPVVKGAWATRVQILAYSLLLAPLALAPVFTGLGGAVYGAVALVCGALLIVLVVKVLRDRSADNRAARNLFAFSILYLFALFAALLAEQIPGVYAPVLAFAGGAS
jgi:protoheme IX farnesyltransferase